MTAFGFAGVFDVLLGITLLLFCVDVSVDVAFDGLEVAILADEVLAAGLLATVFAVEFLALALPAFIFEGATFAETIAAAAARARFTESLSFCDDLSLDDLSLDTLPFKDALVLALVAARLTDDADFAPDLEPLDDTP